MYMTMPAYIIKLDSGMLRYTEIYREILEQITDINVNPAPVCNAASAYVYCGS